MSDTPTPSPAERIATMLTRILGAVRHALAKNPGRLEGPVQVMLYNLLGHQFRQARDRLVRLAERLQAGWVYSPKPRTPREPATQRADRPPRTANPLTTGSLWLFRAVPGHDTAVASADLRNLLAEPEIVAVLAAAPEPAWRILRSICRALGVEKPPVLGPSKPPKPGKPVHVPPPPPPWEIVPATPELPYYSSTPSFFWPWIGPKPKTA